MLHQSALPMPGVNIKTGPAIDFRSIKRSDIMPDVLWINGLPLSVLFMHRATQHMAKRAAKMPKRKRPRGKGLQRNGVWVPSARGEAKRARRAANDLAHAAQKTIEKAFLAAGWKWREVEKWVNQNADGKWSEGLPALARLGGVNVTWEGATA